MAVGKRRRAATAIISLSVIALTIYDLNDATLPPSTSRRYLKSTSYFTQQKRPRPPPPLYQWTNHLHPLSSIPNPTTETSLFYHIPKSGGTTVQSTYECFSLSLANRVGADDSNELVSFKPWPYNSKARYVNVDTTTRRGIDRARKLGLVESNLADLIITSDPIYAIEQLYDSKENLRGRVLLMMRHPVDRLVSKFYYLQMATWEKTYSPQWKNLTLKEWITNTQTNNDNNHVVRRLAGLRPKDNATEADLRLVQRVVRRYFVVGLTNRMEESIHRFHTVLGINHDHYRYKTCMSYFSNDNNSTKSAAASSAGRENYNPHPKPTQEEYELLANTNTLDIKLYDFVSKLFDEQKEAVKEYKKSISSWNGW